MTGVAQAPRLVIVGRNSIVWKRLQPLVDDGRRSVLAVGHADVRNHRLDASDVVWILSFARSASQNVELLEALYRAGARHCFYVSTATANVAGLSRCYGYPRAKCEAEAEAQRILNAEVVRIGLVYEDEAELPAGINAATRLSDLAEHIVHSNAPKGSNSNFFAMVERPFHGNLERMLFRTYARLMRGTSYRPCLLRPFDLLLKAFGMRWYGYLYLSNQHWLIDPPSRADRDGRDPPITKAVAAEGRGFHENSGVS